MRLNYHLVIKPEAKKSVNVGGFPDLERSPSGRCFPKYLSKIAKTNEILIYGFSELPMISMKI